MADKNSTENELGGIAPEDSSRPVEPANGRRQRRARERQSRDADLGRIEIFDDEALVTGAQKSRGIWGRVARLFGSGEPEVIDFEKVNLRSTSLFAEPGRSAVAESPEFESTRRETPPDQRRTVGRDFLDRRLEERAKRMRAMPRVDSSESDVNATFEITLDLAGETLANDTAVLDALGGDEAELGDESAAVFSSIVVAPELITSDVPPKLWPQSLLEDLPAVESIASDSLAPDGVPALEVALEVAPEVAPEVDNQAEAPIEPAEPAAPAEPAKSRGTYHLDIAYGSLGLRAPMRDLLQAANEADNFVGVERLVPASRSITGLAEQYRGRRGDFPQSASPTVAELALAATILPTDRRGRKRLERELQRANRARGSFEPIPGALDSEYQGRRQRRQDELAIIDDVQVHDLAKKRVDATEIASRREAAAPETRRRFQVGRQIGEVAAVVVVGIILAMVVKTFLVQSFVIPSQSMENTLAIGDRIVVSKFTPRFFDLKRGDVAVFADTQNWAGHIARIDPSSVPAKVPDTRNTIQKGLSWLGTAIGVIPETETTFLIKRVIGLPGDTVACCTDTGATVVNGKAMDESFVKPGTDKTQVRYQVTVKPGFVWFQGDNRGESFDSRFNIGWKDQGQVPITSVVGLAKWVIFPIGRMGAIDDHRNIFEQVPPPGTPPEPNLRLNPELQRSLTPWKYIPPTAREAPQPSESSTPVSGATTQPSESSTPISTMQSPIPRPSS